MTKKLNAAKTRKVMLHSTSLPSHAARWWVPVLVVAAVALGGIAVARLRAEFGSEVIFSTTDSAAAPLTPFHVKTVTYYLDGPLQARGSVSYLDEKARPRRVAFLGLPWHLTISTTQPVMIANMVAQSNADHLRCRIAVDGTVHDDQTATGQTAQAFCLVTAA